MLQYDVTEEIIHQHNQKSPYQRVVMTTQHKQSGPLLCNHGNITLDDGRVINRAVS